MSTKPETAVERAELIDWLNQSADQCAVFPSTAHEAKRYRQAAAMLAEDGKAGGEVAGWICITTKRLITPWQYERMEGWERDYYEPVHTRPQQAAQVAQPLKADDVEWVVNDIAELGVKIGDQFFWLYKGYSLVYKDAKHDDGTPMMWRTVGKREFGECCHPVKFWKEGALLPNRYTEELIYTPGLSFGTPEDGKWKPLPSALGIGKDQAS